MNTDTIAAIATPPGPGGIGIIRISGPGAQAIAQRLFRFRVGQESKNAVPHRATKSFEPHRLNYGHVINPATGQPIDETLMAVMPSPHSYTKEDVVEFQLHGGPVILSIILDLIITQGARLSEPGEFTRRAFLNGRIDLIQAEAVADMIQATSEGALQAAVSHLGGALSKTLTPILEQLTHALAELEAGIEFPDDVHVDLDREQFRLALAELVLPPLTALRDSYRHGHVLRDGFRLAIVGRPNVGKSSLLNALLQQERAIVTPIPGTTRDTIEALFYIKGLPIVAIDTAGLHFSDDPVERVGIRKAHEALEAADLVLLVIEAGHPFDPADQAIFLQAPKERTLLVFNKIDLVEDPVETAIPQGVCRSAAVLVSALTGAGINQLKDIIGHYYPCGGKGDSEGTIVTNPRHKVCLDEALETIARAIESSQTGIPEDLIAMDIQQAVNSLNRLMGHQINADILDTIFQRFCIGK